MRRLPTDECIKWRDELLEQMHFSDAERVRVVLQDMDINEGYVASNNWFRVASKRIIWRESQLGKINFQDVIEIRKTLKEIDASSGELVADEWLVGAVPRYELLSKVSFLRPTIAKESARLAKYDSELAMNWLRKVVHRLRFCDELITNLDGEQLSVWAEKKSHTFKMDLMETFQKLGSEKARELVKITLNEMNIDFPEWNDGERSVAMSARMITPEWWCRQAKKQWRVVESILRECGEVHKNGSPYLSRWGLNKFRRQKTANEAFLKSWEAVNQKGQAYTLEDLSSRGVSNPFIRRGELMARIRGTEELAEEMGHIGYFLTLTCPGKYHAVRKNGTRIGKFFKADCPDPREGQYYLCDLWKKIRSKCKREGVKFYGVRVVEPHHDATPHWHMMIFSEASHARAMVEIFKEYAMAEDSEEVKPLSSDPTKNPRYDVKYMDPKQGTAAGYIAKYICKSVDGAHIDKDFETETAGDIASEGITGWARRFGIRQFQFFGGVSVTVWRELRRLTKDIEDSIFPIYTAAHKGRWKEFTEMMGGVFAGRDQTLKVYYEKSDENQYGEIVPVIKGVSRGIEVVITRLYEWTVQKVGAGSVSGAVFCGDGEAAPPWTRVNKCTGRNPPAHFHDDGGGGLWP